MRNQKQDRRSKRTRNLLHNAMIELIIEKPYASITIQDIIDRAGVGRSTFYAHFQDKDDLATSNMEYIIDNLAQHLEQDEVPDIQHIIPSLTLFQHVEEHKEIFEALVRGQGFNLFLEKGQDHWRRKFEEQLEFFLPEGREPKVPLAVVANYMAGNLMFFLKWWADSKSSVSPEQMHEIIQQLVMPGVLETLG